MSGTVQHIIKRCREIIDKYPNIRSWEELAHDDLETWRQLVHRGVEQQLARYADEGEESGITIKQISEMKGIIEWDEKLSGIEED